jgi:2'-5' RNA ligase
MTNAMSSRCRQGQTELPVARPYARRVNRNPTARLFVAVDPPAQICEELCAWAREAACAGGARELANASLRVLDPELLHVTLCFLGNRPVGEMDGLADRLTACDGRSEELSLGAPLWLPQRSPRALTVELHDEHGRLAALRAKLGAALSVQSDGQSSRGVHIGCSAKTEKRRFHPHVTVARLRRDAAPTQRTLPPTPSASFTPRELVLYRSWLSPQGASHEAVATHPIW